MKPGVLFAALLITTLGAFSAVPANPTVSLGSPKVDTRFETSGALSAKWSGTIENHTPLRYEHARLDVVFVDADNKPVFTLTGSEVAAGPHSTVVASGSGEVPRELAGRVVNSMLLVRMNR